jgi:hypothetical protein
VSQAFLNDRSNRPPQLRAVAGERRGGNDEISGTRFLAPCLERAGVS